MQKHFGEKRRIKKLLIIFLRLFFVFIGFLTVLFFIYIKFFFKNKGVISPISKYLITEKGQIQLDNFSQEIKSLLEKQNFTVTYIHIASDSSIQVITKEGEFIFSTKKDFVSQLASLQAINTRLTIEGKRIKRVDFRFDNPIVAF